MSTLKCHYHPESKGTATCPNCNQPICDRCRLNGTSQRCGPCQSAHNKGEDGEGKRPQRVLCHNHKDIPTDMHCRMCRKPYCPACLNSQSKCIDCAMAPPAPGPAPRTRSSTGQLKRTPTGKMKAPPPKKAAMPKWAIPAGGGLLVMLLVFVLASGHHGRRKHNDTPVTGPLKVAITAPAANLTLSSNQTIKLKVASQRDIEKVELTIDGKYWDNFTAPPFESDWQTALFANGSHTIAAKAVYRDHRTATAKVTVKTHNRKVFSSKS